MGTKMRKLILVFAFLLVFVSASHAANELYVDVGTGIVWTDTGGDESLDLGEAAGDNCGDTTVVCIGSYHDFGVDPRPGTYMMEVDLSGFATAPVVDEIVAVYISEGETTSVFSGPESPSDTADGLSAENRLGNMLGPFILTVHSTTAGDNLTGVFYFESYSRHLAPVVHNATADDLEESGDAHTITIYPVAWQVQ